MSVTGVVTRSEYANLLVRHAYRLWQLTIEDSIQDADSRSAERAYWTAVGRAIDFELRSGSW